MQTRTQLALVLIAIAALAAGCGRTTVSGPASSASSTLSAQQAEVVSVLSAVPDVVEDGQFDSSDPWVIGSGASPAALAAINPLRFWRVITDRDVRFEFAFADTDSTGRPTTAIVTVHKLLTGNFNILTGERDEGDTVADSTKRLVQKPLKDRWVRRILLKRFPCPSDTTGNGWRVVATSGVKVTSTGAETRIVSVRVQTAGLDTTITDPLQFFRLRHILPLRSDSPVTVTVTTLRNDDVVVWVRSGHRARFVNNGDNTYTGVWLVPDLHDGNGRDGGRGTLAEQRRRPPIFHFGVNALSNGTLFDDEAPYDSEAWIMPMRLAPDEIADALP